MKICKTVKSVNAIDQTRFHILQVHNQTERDIRGKRTEIMGGGDSRI